MDCVKYSINQISKKGLSLDGIVLLGVLFGGRVISYFFMGNILVSISALLSMFLMLKMILFTDTKPYHEVGLALALGGVLEIVGIIASPIRMFILDITVSYLVYAVMYFALAYIAFKAYYDRQVSLGNVVVTEGGAADLENAVKEMFEEKAKEEAVKHESDETEHQEDVAETEQSPEEKSDEDKSDEEKPDGDKPVDSKEE